MLTRTFAYGALAGLSVLVPISGATAAPAPRHAGVVVDYRASSHTATVALPGGKLIAVHTAVRVRAGTRVRFGKLTHLANGTYSGALHATGRTRATRVRGTVVARPTKGAVAISARGTTFVVRLGRKAPKRSNEVGSGPAVGATITTTVTIDQRGRLETDGAIKVTPPATGDVIDIEGTITGIDQTTRTLTVSVKDDGVSATFNVIVPDTIDITTYAVGDELEASVLANADGTFTLQGSSLNGDSQEAADTSDDEGAQPPEADVETEDPGNSGSGGSSDD